MSENLHSSSLDFARGKRESKWKRPSRIVPAIVILTGACWVGAPLGWAQTAATGALTGTVTDPAGAVVPEVQITVTNEATRETRTASSRADGTYVIPLLPPGSYRVEASRSGFKRSTQSGIRVQVTETAVLNFSLEVGTLQQEVTVEAAPEVLQTESSALGRVTSEEVVTNLPLVTRNYTQIVVLSPGIAAEVTNAAELGRGNGGMSGRTLGFTAHGTSSSDNNFQMNGVEINDVQGSGFVSGGVAVPNPDTIQEFKVQTGQYDASFGRNAGANVNLVTKSGSNQVHGTLFEFFRNEALNANDFFRNRAGQDKPVLKQNQFGFTLAAPIKKDKVLVFGSYQGTRQRNGLDPSCSSSATAMPPLTDDRSPEAVGAIFAGQRGFFQEAFGGLGPAVLPDGSNIHPVALALLQFKLPDGSFLIPSPQQIDLATGLGFSTFSIPCIFDADQFMVNLDFLHTDKSTFSSRFFFDDGSEDISLPPSFAPTVPGSPALRTSRFWNVSLAHRYVFNPNLLNQFEFGFHRIALLTEQKVPFSFSDVGASVPSFENDHPVIALSGAFDLGGNGQTVGIVQNTFVLQDSIFTLRGHHNLRLGGGVTRIQNNIVKFTSIGAVAFLSFPDFLLGLDGINNTTFFSNIAASIDTFGLFDRAFRALDANLFVQDDIRVTSRLTLNLGLRYERIGQFGDELGRNAGFNPALADSTPPAGGGLAGFVVSANFPEAVPDGVTQLDNNFGIDGEGQNNWAPRVGFAWQLPGTDRLVLRGGYGTFLSRPTGQPFVQSLGTPPFGQIRQLSGPLNAAASFDNPFLPAPPIPNFPLLTRTSTETFRSLAPDYRPSIVQQYSLNLQMELARDILLEVGYAGTRGTKLFRTLTFNQALLASPSNPIRGTMTNTVRNIQQRVPFQGIAANGLNLVQSAGESWYNGLEVSLNKRISRGLQFLASYTFSRAISSEGPNIATSAAGLGFAPGDQDNPDARRGRAFFNRRHRFILSYLYDLPGPSNRLSVLGGFLGGWSVAGVTTFQSGQPLTIFATNSANVFGLSGPQQDRAQLASGCMHNDLVNPGSVSDKLNNFFNAACFTTAPVIGNDGIATGFGNGGAGIVEGPGQNNFDIVIIKQTPVRWPTDVSNVEFRAELFNAFNTPQFANPDLQDALDITLASFGQISSTSVAPRIIQFALKFNF